MMERGGGRYLRQLQLHKPPHISHAMEKAPFSLCIMKLNYTDIPETFSTLFTPLCNFSFTRNCLQLFVKIPAEIYSFL